MIPLRLQSEIAQSQEVLVLDPASWVRIAVLMNVYLGLGNSGGQDFGTRGI
jgi:hypothetical protein